MNIKTITQAIIYEEYIEKSHFIGHTLPVTNIQQIEDFINQTSIKHRKANHNVYAYILGNEFEIQKSTDDGEPSGTAGMPILNVLKTGSFTNLVVIVTRYFGGIKLGTGGLMRAYSSVAKTAIEKSNIVTLSLKNHYQITIAYNYLDNALFIIKQKGIEYNITYTDKVTIDFLLDEIYYSDIQKQLSNLMATNILPKLIGQIYN